MDFGVYLDSVVLKAYICNKEAIEKLILNLTLMKTFFEFPAFQVLQLLYKMLLQMTNSKGLLITFLRNVTNLYVNSG